jgi:hypothetical protein
MKQSYIIAFWSPFSLPNLYFYTDFFSSYLKKYGDVVCLDCKNYHDARTIRLLHQADLVIIGLSQNAHLLNSYFCYPPEHFNHVRYLIIDYFSECAMDIHQLCHLYRIPENELAKIPYNPRFQEANRLGLGAQYLEFHGQNQVYDQFIGFQTELYDTGKLLAHALEEEL